MLRVRIQYWMISIMFTIYLAFVKEPTCFKNPYNPSCRSFPYKSSTKFSLEAVTIETGISTFYKMVITVLKVFYKKQKPKIFQYRSYKNFDNQIFQIELNSVLLKIDLNNADPSEFTEIFLSILDKRAPKNKI